MDRVLSSFMLHHLDGAGKAAAMREVLRVLRPGGELHLVDFTVPHVHTGLRGLVYRSPRLAGNQVEQILAALRGGGLTEVAVNGHGRKFFGDHTYYRAVRPA